MDPILVAYYSLTKQKITKRWVFNPSTEPVKYLRVPNDELEALFASRPKVDVRGGFDDLFAEVDFSNPIEEIPDMAASVDVKTSSTNTILSPPHAPGRGENDKGDNIIVKDVTIYEYDRVYEMMQKISLVTNIPYYRLHADYIDETGHPTTTYRLFAGGPYDTSLLSYSHGNSIKVFDGTSDGHRGLYVDKYIYDIRHDARVYVLDTFRIARGIRYVIIADLNEVLVSATFDDKYTTELTYYGLVLKYFPAITLEVFNEYIRSETALSHKFPELAIPPSHLRARFAAEKTVIKAISREKRHDDILTSISRCLVSFSAPGPLNLRNIFDAISTTPRATTLETYIPEVHYFVKDGATTTIFSKIHHGVKQRGLPNQQLLKQGVTVVIARSTPGHDPIYVSFLANGRVYVKMSFAEEDFVVFDDVPSLVKKYTGHVFGNVDAIGVKASPVGPIDTTSMSFDSITANLFWKRIITESQFRELIKSFEEYVTANLLGHYDVVNLTKDSQVYMFKKGTYQFDGTLINRVLIKAGKGDVTNQFAYLTNPVIRTKWMEMYSGRSITVSHRASDVSIEIEDAQAAEFELFKKIATNMLSSSPITNASSSINVKNALSKSREQDPVLFNLKKAGYPVVYARICQKKMQPVVYQEDEYAALPDSLKKKLTKYKNFTYNKPAYYMCPGSNYKHLNFIAGVHPAGYCLPCCFKTAISDKERKARLIYESCTKTFRGPDDLVSDSRHILAINKTLDPGRVGQLPDTVKKIAPRDSYMFGVPQYYKGTFCPLLYIAATAIYEGQLTDGKVTVNGKTIRAPNQPDMITPFIDALYRRLKKSGKVYMPDVRPESIVEAFSGNLFNASDVDWVDIFTRSLSVFWGISLIFVDGDDVDMPARGSLSDKVIVVVKRMYTKESSVNNAGPAWYPLVQISEEYFKSGEVIRMIFDLSKDMDALSNAIVAYNKTEDAKANKVASCSAILDYLSTDGNAPMTSGNTIVYTKYIGRGNKVYALHIESGRFAGLKIPVPYDDYASGREKVSFEPIIFDSPASLVKSFVDTFDMPGYLPFVTSAVLTLGDSNDRQGDIYIGAVINDLHFQHLPTASSPFINPSWNLAERTIVLSAAPDAVIAALITGAKGVTTSPIDFYKYYVYELILMQVVEELRKERDDTVHGAIRDAFGTLKSRADIPRALKALNNLIPRGSDDFNKIVAVIEAWPRGRPLSEMTTAIDALSLSADTEKMMKAITMDGITQAIARSCIRGRVTLKEFPNVYESCGDKDKDRGYCSSGRLIVDVTDDYWSRVPELIYEDLSNPIKRPYLIDRMYYDNIIDEFSYSVAADESLFIRKK